MIAAVIERCAGIDVGKRFLKVCVMVGPLHQEPRQEIRKVGCSTWELQQLREWLQAEGVTHAVMESTGPYWVPVFNVLEAGVKVILANPEQVKNRKGHKTDAKDSWWLAHLLRHGMIRASYIPEKGTRELRELTRRRKKLVGAVAQERNRVQKQLEYGNVKLGNVLSDVFGVSGQAMIKALVDEDRTPEQIGELARGQAKQKSAAIANAVRGHCLSEVHKEMIRSSMRHMAFLEREIELLDRLIGERIGALGQQPQYELLQTIPGIQREAAGSVLAEVGPDTKPFPGAAQLSSWVGICPGNNESAGEHKSRHTTKGNRWLRMTVCECAWAASRTKGSVFQQKYQRLAPRIGHKRAIVAVAHALVVAIYYVLDRREPYQHAAPEILTEIERRRLIRHHTRRLHHLEHWLGPQHLTPAPTWSSPPLPAPPGG